MHPVIARSSRFEDLLGLQQHDTPYAFETIFRNDGYFARRASKRKYKLLKRIDPMLRQLLEPGERVRFLTEASDLSFWESYWLGFIGYLTNRRALVLTDRRILMVQIDWKNRPKELFSQIRYPSIDTIKTSWLGTTVMIKLDDGTKRMQQGMPKPDRKVLVELAAKLGDVVIKDGSGVEDLCPHCFAVVAGRPNFCPVCKGQFKSARTAMLRSLLFPGLGDFYLGHWKFAIWETLFVGFVWLGVLLPIFFPDPEYPMTTVENVTMAVFIVLFLHVPDALLTRWVGKKGIYPAGSGKVGGRLIIRRKVEQKAAQPMAGMTAPALQ